MEHPRQAKRRSIIIAVIMAAQVVVTLVFLIFAFYQKEEADMQRLTAEEQSQVARRASFQARKAEKLIDSLTTELEKLKLIVEKK